MSDLFIQLVRSEKTEWLLSKHPNAFLLLTLIAYRARRTFGCPDGYEIGECHIGDYKECGLKSEKTYIVAKKRLEKEGFVKIIETCRNRQKGATGRATTGTKVKLLNSDVYDINPQVEGDRKGDRGATEGRPRGDEQQCNNGNNEKEQQPQTPKGACVVFSCFEKINDPSIDQKEKARLTRKYEGNEQVVIDAVNSVLQSSFTPEKSLLISLRAAIKGLWKPLPEKEDSIKLNKKKALELQMTGHPFYKIEACNTYLEIVAGHLSHVVQYELSSEKFNKQVNEHLKIGKQA